MDRDPDHRLFLFRAEHGLEALFVRETDKAVNVLPVQARRPKQFEKASAECLNRSSGDALSLFACVLVTERGFQISQSNQSAAAIQMVN
jgi:hypothetical protein